MEVEGGDLGGPFCSQRGAGAVRGGEAGTIDGSSAGAEAAFPPRISTMERGLRRAAAATRAAVGCSIAENVSRALCWQANTYCYSRETREPGHRRTDTS
eukprot:scaffold91114_cov64-Phaeocystis_antarctica.AAC.9